MAKRANVRYVAPALLIGVLALGILLSGHGEEGGPVGTRADFARLLKEAEDQAVPVLERVDGGKEVSDADRHTLVDAKAKLARLAADTPTAVVPAFLAGKIDQVLRNGDSAERELRTAIANIEAAAPTGPLRLTRIEAHHLLSLTFFDQGRYEEAYNEADFAVKAIPQSALYHAARASAAIQLGRLDTARADVSAALRIDPANERARQLRALLDRS